MIRMKRGVSEASAAVVAACEHQRHLDGSADALECAKTAIAITLAWMDGAESWDGWTFIRGGEL